LLEDGKTHRKKEKVEQVVGKREFLSINAINFLTQSRRDDLISMIYTLIMLHQRYVLRDSDKVLSSEKLC
jgi:hypothetical protein